MLLLFSFIASLAAGITEVLLWKKSMPLYKKFLSVICSGAVVSVITAILWKYVLCQPSFLSAFTWKNSLFFFVFAFLVSVIVLLLRWLFRFSKRFGTADASIPSGNTAKIAGVFLVFLGCMAIFATNWSKTEYGDLPADQVLITYASPTVGSSMVDYLDVVEGPVMLSLFFAMLYGLYAFSRFRLKGSRPGTFRIGEASRKRLCLLLALSVFSGGLLYGIFRFRLISVVNAYCNPSSLIEAHYVDPEDANLRFPEQKRNLIHIYLESMENSYMDQAQGGFMDTNLIPELTEIAGEGYSFSHLDHQFGGPRSAVGTTWSVASMVNMSTGLPMKVPTEKSDYNTSADFLPGACTLGDLLAEQGYEQTLMFGADAEFGGLSYYFQSHGDFKIMDYQYALEQDMIPQDYFVWWGYEDDKLFEFARQELVRLSQTGKPFHFMMETADTHRPEGYVSADTQHKYPNQYANVLAYSSAETAEFIRWIQTQPFYENTTLVITGDHLSMESVFFEFYDFPQDFRRSQYNVILNPIPGSATRDHRILFNRDYANFDFFPTILTSIGATYDGHRLGIGTDLFSGEPTLFEQYGFEVVNLELEQKSEFYNSQILEDPEA